MRRIILHVVDSPKWVGAYETTRAGVILARTKILPTRGKIVIFAIKPEWIMVIPILVQLYPEGTEPVCVQYYCRAASVAVTIAYTLGYVAAGVV